MNRSTPLKKVIIALVLSLSLNIVLLSKELFFTYGAAKSSKSSSRLFQRDEKDADFILQTLFESTSRELILSLEDSRAIHHGLRVQDYAVSLLEQRDQMDIQRALKYRTEALQKKTLQQNIANHSHTLTLYTNLIEEDFKKLKTFLNQEKWPQNAKALHQMTQENWLSHSQTELIHTFKHTSTHRFFETLFKDYPLGNPHYLTSLLLQSTWKNIEEIELQDPGFSIQNQRDLRKDLRRTFLLLELHRKNHLAAYWLLISDYSFALHSLKDGEVQLILSLIQEPTRESLQFIDEILSSPRAPEVIKSANILKKTYQSHLFESSSSDELDLIGS